ncbi:MAG: S-layer homology domain-containing protein, partial [Clostridia bacterium]|nr:S-layer homology domain-containing protein [Clostridia bacterium]
MKKIISFLLCIVMCLNIVYISAYAQDDYKFTDEQKTLLTAIGMYNNEIQLSEEITRGEFADMLVRSIFDEPQYLIGENQQAFNDVDVDNEYYAPVMLLKNLKVTLGDGAGNFKPDEKILANDAIVMAVRFLGYTKLAERTGYIPFAAQKGISKGMQYSYEENLTVYNALLLIFNVLSVDVSEQYVTDSTASFIKNYRTLHKVEGVVNDDGFINKYGLSEIAKDEIVIDGKIYKNATSHKNLFGYNVVAYYKASKNSDATIVALTVTDKNNTLSINAKNIEK